MSVGFFLSAFERYIYKLTIRPHLREPELTQRMVRELAQEQVPVQETALEQALVLGLAPGSVPAQALVLGWFQPGSQAPGSVPTLDSYQLLLPALQALGQAQPRSRALELAQVPGRR